MDDRALALFLDKVQVEPNTGCWLWSGAWCEGYGIVSIGGKMFRAHRAAYEHYVGPIPNGLTLDHLCRAPCCVNPDHMEPVTSKVNILRSHGITATNAKKENCGACGAPYSGDNLYVTPDGFRQCRSCLRKNQRKRREAHNAYRREWRAKRKLERKEDRP